MPDIVWNGADVPTTEISWDNLFRQSGASIVLSTGSNKEYLYDWDMSTRVSFAAGAVTITLTLSSASDCDHFWMMSHTLGSDGGTIAGEYWNGSSWSTMFSDAVPPDDKIYWLDFDNVNATKFRITVTSITACEIGHMFLGTPLVMQRGITHPFTPIGYGASSETMVYANHRGYPMGRSVRIAPQKTVMNIRGLRQEWVRDNLLDAIEHIKRFGAFGLRWSTMFPSEVCLAWLEEDIGDVRYNDPTTMSLSWKVSMVCQ